MRILILANARSPHTVRWATSLAARGHEVHVAGIRYQAIDGVVVHRFGVGRADSLSPVAALASYAVLYWRIRALVARVRPDVVNPHYASTHGVIARRIRGRPVVLTVWGSDVLRGDRPRRGLPRLLARLALRGADAVTSASGFMAGAVRQIAGSPVDVSIVPFGVDTDRFFPRTKGEGAFTIGFLKAFRPRYAPEVLLEAFERVAVELPDTRLLMAGDGPQLRSLAGRVTRSSWAERVRFAGRISHDEVPEFLAGVDVLVNPSRSESFGVVILEASACAIPVVATDVGGVPETLVDGRTGLLVPVDDADAMADAILRLAVDPEERKRMGAEGRLMVIERFRWQTCVDAMLRVFDGVVSGRTT